MVKVKIFGFEGGYYNLPAKLKKEFINLGHEIVDQESDLLIHLTGGFDEAEEFYKKCLKKPIRLYILLDIDTNKSSKWYFNIKQDLESSEIPCVISETVAKQVKEILKIDRQLNILHYPISDVTYLNQIKTLDFLYCGRCYSGNKRFELIGETLDVLKVDRRNLIVCGSENPSFGYYIGIVDDGILNQLFNSVRFVLCPSSFEGQGLSALQAVVAGAFPIVTRDNEVIYEFGLDEFAAEPNPLSLAKKINEIRCDEGYYRNILNELRPEYEKKFRVNVMVKNILNLNERFCKL